MNKFLTTILLTLLFAVGAAAQNTKANAKKLFGEERYDEAKPILHQLLKKNSKAGDLNYWYAVCCYKTGDTAANVEELLKYAITRKVADASKHLGDIYLEQFRYEESIEQYEDFISLTKNEEDKELYKAKIAHTKLLFRMMKTTEQVCVVDSFIVDEQSFIDSYRCGRDIGTLHYLSDYFDDDNLHGILSETERKTDIYYSLPVSKDSVSLLKIFHSSKNGEEWSGALPINGFDTKGNDNYPFMCADGSTFYFASDGEGSIGGYDIFVTRYNSENGSFLLPNNVGMPFNSEANDYMMVINEIANLGWFATDRRMPEGKVCIYVFIPNKIKNVYNYENVPYERMLSLSQLTSIADTQDDENMVRDARRQLTILMYEQHETSDEGDFLFILDDMTDYSSLSDFECDEAKRIFEEWTRRKAKLQRDLSSLEEKRDAYADADDATKSRMSNELLMLEQALEREEEALEAMEKEIRNKELLYLNR